MSAAPPTPLETNGGARYASSAEISACLRALAAASAGRATLTRTPPGAAGGLEVLACHVADLARAAPGRLRVLLVGSLHGASEAAPGEALLALARDVLCGRLQDLAGALELIFIPNPNPAGRDADSARNAAGVNLNRDFVLLSQPESRALDAALRHWAPDVVLDAHESAVLKRRTLGAAGYLTAFEAQFDVASTPAIPVAARAYATDVLLPALLAAVRARGLHAQRYIGEIRAPDQPITHGNLTLRAFRNKAGVRGALAVLLETPMEPKADPHPSFRNIAARVARQRACIEAFLATVRDQAPAIAAARARAAAEPAHEIALAARYVRRPAHATVTLPLRERASGALVPTVFPDHRAMEAEAPLRVPAQYVITAHTALLREFLARHGIACQPLAHPRTLPLIAEVYAGGTDPDAACVPVGERAGECTVPAGALCVPLAGTQRRLVPLLVEPRSPSSVFRYPEYAALLRANEPFFIARTDVL